MESVKRGGDRQELHERLRQYSNAAGKAIKLEGKDNDLLERVAVDPGFMLTKDDLARILDVKAFVGRAPQQTEEFVRDIIDPLLARAAQYGVIDKTELIV